MVGVAARSQPEDVKTATFGTLLSIGLLCGCDLFPSGDTDTDGGSSTSSGTTGTADTEPDDPSDTQPGGTSSGGESGGSGGAADPDCSPHVTAASIAAASEQFDAGAAVIALDDTGCLQLHREFDGDAVSHSEVTRGGTPVEVWDFDGQMSTGHLDRDAEGVFQTRISIEATGDPADTIVVTEKGVPVIWRQTMTDSGTGVQVVEEDLVAGTTEVYETDYDDAANDVDLGSGPGGCDSADEAHILESFPLAVERGLQCLEDYGLQEGHDRLSALATKGVHFRCADLPGNRVAQFSRWSYFTNNMAGLQRPIVIVDGEFAGTISQGLLFHELMHAHFAPHDTDGISTMQGPNLTFDRSHLDEVYACQALCFDEMPDKCQCAKCLDTDPCDPRCADLAECPAESVVRCPCNGTDYGSMAECAVYCQSGFNCVFSQTCVELDLSCD